MRWPTTPTPRLSASSAPALSASCRLAAPPSSPQNRRLRCKPPRLCIRANQPSARCVAIIRLRWPERQPPAARQLRDLQPQSLRLSAPVYPDPHGMYRCQVEPERLAPHMREVIQYMINNNQASSESERVLASYALRIRRMYEPADAAPCQCVHVCAPACGARAPVLP